MPHCEELGLAENWASICAKPQTQNPHQEVRATSLDTPFQVPGDPSLQAGASSSFQTQVRAPSEEVALLQA